MLIGRMPLVRQLLDPTLQMLRPIPVTAWLPLSMIIFGLGPRSAFFLVFLGAFYPILLNTDLRRALGRAAPVRGGRMLGCEGHGAVLQGRAAGRLPSIFTGLRLGLGFAWVVIVVGEMTGVQTGLGAIIMEARQLSRTEIVICGHDRDRRRRLHLRPAGHAARPPPAALESRRMAEADRSRSWN